MSIIEKAVARLGDWTSAAPNADALRQTSSSHHPGSMERGGDPNSDAGWESSGSAAGPGADSLSDRTLRYEEIDLLRTTRNRT